MIEIPLTNNTHQEFSIVIGENTYNIRVVYNSRGNVWLMDLIQSGVTILDGISLLGGVDIFNQYNIPITNAYVVNVNNSRLDANSINLGTSVKLVILTEEEVLSVQAV